MKKLFSLFVMFTVFFAFTMPIDARRSTRRSTDTETSNRRTNTRSGRSSGARSSRTNTRSGRSTNARAGRSSGRSGSSRSARTANLAVSSTSSESVATDTPAVEEPAKDFSKYAIDLDALNAGANSIKQCQSKMLECAKNTIPSDDKKSVQLGLCKASSKRNSFKDKEKSLSGIEKKLFSVMGQKGKAKLTAKELSVYKTLGNLFDGEGATDSDKDGVWDDEEEESIVDSMNRMQEEMDALDDAFAGNNKSATPKALFENIFKSCHAIVDTCESVIGVESMKMYIKGMSEDACNKYDNNLESKYNKQVLMLNQVKSQTKLAYMKNRRKNMISTEEGFAKIQETLENTVCGKDMVKCLYCGENQTNETACIKDLTSKMGTYKATVQDTLDAISYGDDARGDGIWKAYLEKAKNKITEFARMSNYSTKENATKGLETATKTFLKDAKECLVESGGEGMLAYADQTKFSATLSQFNSASFKQDDLLNATVNLSEAKDICAPTIVSLKNNLKLLEANPNVDSSLLPWKKISKRKKSQETINSYANTLFEGMYKKAQAKGTQTLEEEGVNLLKRNTEFLAARVEMYTATKGAEAANYESDIELSKRKNSADTDLTVTENTNLLKVDDAEKDLVVGMDANTMEENTSSTKAEILAQIMQGAKDFAAKRVKYQTTCSGLGGTFGTIEIASDGTETGTDKVPVGGTCSLEITGKGTKTTTAETDATGGVLFGLIGRNSSETTTSYDPIENKTTLILSSLNKFRFDCTIDGSTSSSSGYGGGGVLGGGRFWLVGGASSSSSTSSSATNKCLLPNGSALNYTACYMPSLDDATFDGEAEEGSCFGQVPATE